MGRALGLILMLLAIGLGLRLYSAAIERSVYGGFAAIDDAAADTDAAEVEDEARPPDRASPDSARRRPLTERVRERATQHVQRGADRYRNR